MTHTPTDSLRYLEARIGSGLEYVIDRLGWSLLDGLTEDETEDLQNILESLQAEIQAQRKSHTANRWYYDDGRAVKSRADIEEGHYTEQVWHPDPGAEPEPHSWRGNLLSGEPDVASPGIYEVTITPEDQQIHVRTVRLVADE